MCDYECPKCKTEYNATGSHEDDEGERECDECGFKFIVEVEYDPTYDTHCVEHQYGEVETFHDGFRFRRCEHCGKCEAEKDAS